MRNKRFWTPTIIGALVTPVCLYLAPAGAGHAGPGAALVLYPVPLFSMLLLSVASSGDAFLSRAAGALALAGAVLQFPFYGFIISYARLKGSLWLTLFAGLVWLHIIFIGVWLALASFMWIALKV